MKTLEDTSHAGISVKNILFATDFSEASQAALPYAAAIARRYDSQLHIAHIMSPASYIIPSQPGDRVSLDSIHEAARADVRQRMEAVASHLKTVLHHTYIREGEVWKSLADLIQTHEIDLLVVGTHGRTGAEKLLLGSKAEEILRLAPCPVLTLGPKISGKAKLPALEGEGKDLTPVEISVGQIVYATDFSPESLAACDLPGPGISIQAHSATCDREAQGQGPPDGTDRSRPPKAGEVGAGRSQPVVLTQTSVQIGPPAECILQEALDTTADFIVLGVRATAGHLGAATHLPWATAHKVIAQAHCPVLTIQYNATLHPKEVREGFCEFGEILL